MQTQRAVARLDARLTRLAGGNPGDYKALGGVYELRIDYGPGYRIYFAFSDTQGALFLSLKSGKISKRGDVESPRCLVFRGGVQDGRDISS